MTDNIQDALNRVKEMQELINERRFFKGYSGLARIISGIIALIGSVMLSSSLAPKTYLAHLIGWGSILAASLIFHYGALLAWFFNEPASRRDMFKLKPAIDAVPPLFAGGILSIAFIMNSQFHLLFGTWLLLYGVAQTTYRRTMPNFIFIIGLCYIACGAILTLFPVVPFFMAWPVGIIFFIGELWGGIIMYREARKLAKSGNG